MANDLPPVPASALPPVPVPPRVVLFLALQDADRLGWTLLNSMRDIYDCPVGCHVRAILAGPAGSDSVPIHPGLWPEVVVQCRPIWTVMANNMGQPYTVFGKANLIRPLLDEAYSSQFLRGVPLVCDILDVCLPSLMPTVEERRGFDDAYCSWLIGRHLSTGFDGAQDFMLNFWR